MKHIATLVASGVAIGVLLLGGHAAAAKEQGRIAFARNGRIYVINPDGSGLKRLRFRANVKPNCVGEGDCTKTIEWSDPAWSPNGKRLALLGRFENGTLDGDTRVYIRDANSRTRAVFVSDVGTGGVSWSPDGVWLAHDTGRDDPTPILIRVRTGKEHFLVKTVAKRPTGLNATWSPRGDRLAFHYARGSDANGFPIWQGIATIRGDGSNFKALTRSGDDPDWSPDGTKIAFGSDDIRTVDRDGHVVLLVSASRNPSWSADGSRIVFERGNDLWIMDSNGSNQHLLVPDGRAPDWSPA